MAKKKSQKRRKRRSTTRRERSGSPAIRALSERIAAAGPSYIQDNFERIMLGCHVLRQEPEFEALYFEPRQTLEAAGRHYPRFRRRLMRAIQKDDEDAASLVYDEYRIAALKELDTPEFRRKLQRGLGQCIDRLKDSYEAEKFEMALILSAMLSDEMDWGKARPPLGLYSLVTTIYEDSVNRAMETLPDAHTIVGDEFYSLWCAKHHQADVALINQAVEGLTSFQELAQRIATDDELALAWRRQEKSLLNEFGECVAEGLSFSEDFFSAAEVSLAVEKMEKRYWSKPWSLSRYVAVLAMYNFAKCIREAVSEIMSPQRMAELTDWLEAAGQECLEAEDERLRSLVLPVQAAVSHLQTEKRPSQNRIVLTTYLMSWLTVYRDSDSFGPHWQRLFKQIRKMTRKMGR